MVRNGVWKHLYSSGGKLGIIILVLGSIALGITIQWLWIERECGLDNLFTNTVTKCRDNKLRLVAGGPLVMVLNFGALWIISRAICTYSKGDIDNEIRGILLAISTPGILGLVIIAGGHRLPIIIAIVIILQLIIYSRYLHTPAVRLADTLLSYLRAGITLQSDGTNLEVRISGDLDRLQILTAKRRILTCFAAQKFSAIRVHADQEYASTHLVTEWLAKISASRSMPFSVGELKK